MTKKELNDLSAELLHVFEKIQTLSSENRSITIENDGWKESFGSLVECFEPKLNYFRKNLSKVADKLPGRRKKNV